MVKFKIFFGSSTNQLGKGMTADDKANAWLAENPNIDILQMKYQQARYGDHSICIMYEEKKETSNSSTPYPQAGNLYWPPGVRGINDEGEQK